jgi:hypothetical protein
MDYSKANKLRTLFEKLELDPKIADELGVLSVEDFGILEERHIVDVCKNLKLRAVQETKLRMLCELEAQKCRAAESAEGARGSGLSAAVVFLSQTSSKKDADSADFRSDCLYD